MTFSAESWSSADKHRTIEDDQSDVRLYLDTDDVGPEAITESNVQRIVDALNREFYPDAS